MRSLKVSMKVLVAMLGLSTITGCFLEDSVTSGISDGISSGLATVVEEFIISSTPSGDGDE